MRISDWFFLLAGVLLSSLGGIFLKLGALQINHDNGVMTAVAQILMQWRIYLGVVFYFIPVLIWIYMLKRIDITYLQPMFALVYVVTPLISAFMLHETMPPERWIGVFVVLLGIAIVART